jgi:hypothetical protein
MMTRKDDLDYARAEAERIPTTATDPAAFADALARQLPVGIFALDFIDPALAAEYDAARAELKDLVPDLAEAGVDHPFTRMDEATRAWAVESYHAGVRAGAAYEYLRRALTDG